MRNVWFLLVEQRMGLIAEMESIQFQGLSHITCFESSFFHDVDWQSFDEGLLVIWNSSMKKPMLDIHFSIQFLYMGELRMNLCSIWRTSSYVLPSAYHLTTWYKWVEALAVGKLHTAYKGIIVGG